MKKLILAAVSAAALFGIAACSDSTDKTTTQSTKPATTEPATPPAVAPTTTAPDTGTQTKPAAPAQ
jgi:opacity protein-like surface antigen